MNRRLILNTLRSFLDTNEPQLVYFLVNLWDKQKQAITYKEIREALLSGDLSLEYLEQWHQDYSTFVIEKLEPMWIEAIKTRAKIIEARFPEWNFDPMGDGVLEWVTNYGAEFVTNVTQTQIEGLRAVITRASALEDMTVDDLSRAIRPMVGLTKQQTAANIRYYENLIKNGMSERRSRDLSIRYSARQHRYRGYNIARTELAFSYNQGAYQATKQAQAAGYLGECEKVWLTADDERVCEICGGLDGKAITMDEDFGFHTRLEGLPQAQTIRRVPPAHPSCRCAVGFREIAPPLPRNYVIL